MVEPNVLGLTSYQEALRAIGSLLEPARELRVVEHVSRALVEISAGGEPRELDPAQLEEIVLTSHARRGEHRAAGSMSDVLRSVGRALDELHASDICLVAGPENLSVRFHDLANRPHDLTYAGEELEALLRAAAARRNGQPLRRVLILQTSAESAAPLVELLVAEFAVQALPTLYARAVAAAAEPPDLIIAQTGVETAPVVEAIRALRVGHSTVRVPILALVTEGNGQDHRATFDAGADDLLEEPVQPAQLRARIRTWLLRKPVGG